MWKLKRNDQMNLWLQGEGIIRDLWGIVRYTPLYLKGIINKNLLYSTCSKLCASLDARQVWERMDTCICICMPESLCCLLKLPQHSLFTDYTLIQNKKFKVWETKKRK